jgi:DNA-directed RNA polymerase subunit beta
MMKKLKNLFKDVNNHPNIDYVDATLKKDAGTTQDEGLIEVYKRIRPGDLATAENARESDPCDVFQFRSL